LSHGKRGGLGGGDSNEPRRSFERRAGLIILAGMERLSLRKEGRELSLAKEGKSATLNSCKGKGEDNHPKKIVIILIGKKETQLPRSRKNPPFLFERKKNRN